MTMKVYYSSASGFCFGHNTSFLVFYYIFSVYMHYFVNRVNKKIILCIIKRYKNYVIVNTCFIKLYDLLNIL